MSSQNSHILERNWHSRSKNS